MASCAPPLSWFVPSAFQGGTTMDSRPNKKQRAAVTRERMPRSKLEKSGQSQARRLRARSRPTDVRRRVGRRTADDRSFQKACVRPLPQLTMSYSASGNPSMPLIYPGSPGKPSLTSWSTAIENSRTERPNEAQGGARSSMRRSGAISRTKRPLIPVGEISPRSM